MPNDARPPTHSPQRPWTTRDDAVCLAALPLHPVSCHTGHCSAASPSSNQAPPAKIHPCCISRAVEPSTARSFFPHTVALSSLTQLLCPTFLHAPGALVASAVSGVPCLSCLCCSFHSDDMCEYAYMNCVSMFLSWLIADGRPWFFLY